MVITYFGEGCFRLASGERSCVIDPASARFKADVTLKTAASTRGLYSAEHTGTFGKPGDDGVVFFPGEYEALGWEVEGFMIASESDEKTLRTAYLLRQEDIAVAAVGALTKPIDIALTENIGEPDILLVHIDGEKLLSPDGIAKLVKQLAPRVAVVGVAADAKKATKAFGENAEELEKLVVKKKDLGGDGTRIVVLVASH